MLVALGCCSWTHLTAWVSETSRSTRQLQDCPAGPVSSLAESPVLFHIGLGWQKAHVSPVGVCRG